MWIRGSILIRVILAVLEIGCSPSLWEITAKWKSADGRWVSIVQLVAGELAIPMFFEPMSRGLPSTNSFR